MKPIKNIIFFKGKFKGILHMRGISINDIRKAFFPKDFNEKYSYLGYIHTNLKGKYFKYLYPLILAMDFEAKPKHCPRWFLRFLELFGNDNSIVRIRNHKLHDLHRKLTKGIRFIDWKTKWADYDLRISIIAPEHLQDLADAI